MTSTLYLGLTKEGKQIGLFRTSAEAFLKEDVHEAQIWNLNKRTGQYHPTNGSVLQFDILPKQDEEHGDKKCEST